MNRDGVNLARMRDFAAALEGTEEGDLLEWAVGALVEAEKQPRWVSLKFEPELGDAETFFDVWNAAPRVRRIRGEYVDEEGRLWNLVVPVSYVDSVAAVTYRMMSE